MMRYITREQDGFTLIETMVAMVIFTIGILALFGMQTAAIKENLAANNITTGATLASDRVEQLIALNYDDTEISEGGAGISQYASCDDLSSDNWWRTLSATQRVKEDFLGETANHPDYFVYWAVSKGCTLVKEGGIGLDDDSPYRPKHLHITVTRDNGSGDEEVTAAFSYIKQNPNY
ncbi:MAG: prepilin-type N-terminal cleavage/methylation domain-containing protein [Candidatus Electrothrix aestuarii]|uniref:Prepilin-type N-terminal cleavage/methylation domain-containing protein n=1 Tax=Candidatus Electrothrix aestuarii TaxID=3062594 RepID=A0AAU8LSA2_9BACT|nr:prepilin-type N-terminal cleavage/methylation domain-containing protein [Candidatus Electrothrix aestuarii]